MIKEFHIISQVLLMIRLIVDYVFVVFFNYSMIDKLYELFIKINKAFCLRLIEGYLTRF